jgi:hypothetical protein
MEKQTISTSMSPQVIIKQAQGNLEVKGWDEATVVVEADPESLTLEHQDDVIRLGCEDNLIVRLPSGASLQIESVHGDAQIKNLEEALTIGDVHGSLTLREVAAARIGAVHGNLHAKYVSGDLEIAAIHGNASVRDVQGKCSLPDVHGNLDLRDVEGDLDVTARGNARLRLSDILGAQYRIRAEGNVHCNIPEDASLKLSLSSEAEMIRVKLPETTRNYQQSQCELTVGGGKSAMTISAGGVLYLFAQSVDWGEREDEPVSAYSGLPPDFSERIARQVQEQIQAQMETMTRQLDQQMSRLSEQVGRAGLPPEDIEHIMEMARQTSEHETERAQEKIRRAQDKLERKLDAARRRQEAKAQMTDRRERSRTKLSWSFDLNPSPPPPVKEPVSEEERLTILRMLEQKKISLEEAEQLLSALEEN